MRFAFSFGSYFIVVVPVLVLDFVTRSFNWSSLIWCRNHSNATRTSDGRECSEMAWNTSSNWSKWTSSPRFKHWFNGRCWWLERGFTEAWSSARERERKRRVTCLLSEQTSAMRASAAIKNWFKRAWSVYSPGLAVASNDEVGSIIDDERMCLSAPHGRRRTVSDIKNTEKENFSIEFRSK